MGVAVALQQPEVPVEPGTESSSDVRIRNTGAMVDQFELDVVGEAASWAHVEPAQVNLMPGEESTARLVFAPPKSSRVIAGPVPFAVRVMSREDTAGSAIEEAVVTVGSFSQVAADIVPRTSHGRFSGRHELALDNLGNHPELVAIAVSDPDRLMTFRLDPANTTVSPGTATFVRLKAKPKKSFWIGPNKTLPFHIAVTAEDSEPVTLQASLVQQSILPPWFFKAVAFLIALAVALAALWFAFLKPQIESTAKAAAADQTERLADAIEAGNKQSEQAASDAAAAQKAASDSAQQAQQAAKQADTIQQKTEKDGTGGAGTGTLVPASAIDFRILTSVPVAGGFSATPQDVPDGKVLWISDIVLQNPAGDTGLLRIQRGDDVLFEFGLENFRDLDYHLIQPVKFTDSDTVIVAVDCRNTADDCSPSVYFSGQIKKAPQ